MLKWAGQPKTACCVLSSWQKGAPFSVSRRMGVAAVVSRDSDHAVGVGGAKSYTLPDQRVETRRLSNERTARRWFSTSLSAPSERKAMKVPSMGNKIGSGKVAEWKVDIGDVVAANEVVCVIDTDKVSIRIEAECPGRVVSRAAAVGETISVGDDLMTIAPIEDVVGHTESGYRPGIRFRYGYNSLRLPSSAPRTPTPAQPQSLGTESTSKPVTPPKPSPPKHCDNVERFENLSSVPLPWQPVQLTEEEIDLINMGGGTAATDKAIGVWKSEARRVT